MDPAAPEPRRVLELDDNALALESADRVTLRVRGRLTPAQVQAFIAFEAQIWSDEAEIYALIDIRGLQMMPPGTIQALVEGYRRSPRHIIALIGGSFAMRTMIQTVLRALRFLARRHEAKFFDNESEALAWINAQRARRAERGA